MSRLTPPEIRLCFWGCGHWRIRDRNKTAIPVVITNLDSVDRAITATFTHLKLED